jgi:hypothetical protein
MNKRKKKNKGRMNERKGKKINKERKKIRKEKRQDRHKQNRRCKGKAHPITGHPGPRGGVGYNATHSQPRS